MKAEPVTVVETLQFVREGEGLLSVDERLGLIQHVARYPKSGAVIPGTGGVRKLRWGLSGRGKSGRARVVYFYYNESVPNFLLTIFAKNVRVDLSQQERNEMRRLVQALVEGYGARRT